MALDSTANLLFTIGADSSDAQANVQRFRAILSKDLDGLKGEFGDWSRKVFGDLSSVGSAFTAASAGIAAAGVALGSALLAAADRSAKYALELDEVADKTGLAVEAVAGLRYAADVTTTSQSALTQGLSFFAAAIDAARDKTSKQAEEFRRLGISQQEIEAGSRDILPLLYRVSDAFRDDMTAVERAAVARRLFGRGGSELVEMLSRGSDGLREFAREAERMGLVIGEDSVAAAKKWQAEITFLKASLEGLAVTVGKIVLPALNNIVIGADAALGGMRAMLAAGSPLDPLTWAKVGAAMGAAGQEAYERLEAAAKTAAASREGLGPPADDGEKERKKALSQYEGLSSLLDRVRDRLAGLGTEEEQIAADTAKLNREVIDAIDALTKLNVEGKINVETFQREAAAIAQLLPAIEALTAARLNAAGEKHWEALAKMGPALRRTSLDLITQMTESVRPDALLAALGDWRQKIDTALLDQMSGAVADYQTRLAANMTGLSGLFTDELGQAIRGNQALVEEWAASAHQSMMLVRVAAESLRETSVAAFGHFSRAMGANIAQAIIYKASIGEAMRAAVASTLQAIAAESMVQAIYASAIGFLRLAQWDAAGAASAFKAAALFGSVGVAAAVAGRAIAPQQAGAGASGSGYSGATGSGGGSAASSASNERQGPSVQIVS